jgi:RHS repeat-associated protein
VFDQAGRLLAEHDGATGAVLREYVWLDDMPVAMIDSTSASPATYFIHTGQIEEPLVMTDGSQTKVWDAYVEPFGSATVFGTPSAGLDLRLPGQFTQAETGALSQNWNRDYDTSLGRYIEADPIGLAGGQNVYGYGDPLDDVDPLGLQAFKFYGNWGGPGWANGEWRSEGNTLPSPGDANYRPPIDAQDACYEGHDRCISRAVKARATLMCRKPRTAKPKLNPIQVCDVRLSRCLLSLPSSQRTLQSDAAAVSFGAAIPFLIHRK